MPVRSGSRELTGDLGLLSLFDLCQTLALNQATGSLKLESDAGKGYIHFDAGCIVNGQDEAGREGERAVRSLFRWREARFSFQSGPVSAPRAIELPTQSFLLDVAREQDEAREAAGDAQPQASQVERLQAHDALRQAFAKLSREARRVRGMPPGGQISELMDHLAEAPGGELRLRPGRPVMARNADGWRNLGAQSLEPGEFDELLRLLSPPGVVLASGQSALPRSPSGTQFRAVFGEDLFGPFLLVRSLHSTAPALESVELGDGLTWDEILGAGWLDVRGARGSGKSYFLAAAARAACERGLSVAWGCPEPAAVLAELDLPVNYLAGGPLTGEAFLDLALHLKADLVIWDGPSASLSGLASLPEWGVGLLTAGSTGAGPQLRLRVTPAHVARFRVDRLPLAA